MQKYYLEFENPIKEIDLEISQLESSRSVSPDILNKIGSLGKKRNEIKNQDIHTWREGKRRKQNEKETEGDENR